MAVIAFRCSIRKNQGWMAQPAVNLCVLTGQWEPCLVMIKGIDFFIEMPPFRRVAEVAAQFEILAMRVAISLPEEEKYAADQN
ncbi:MAG: hypothetical protein L0Y37_07495 [Bacteroidales bacterium]|nr:hypothetical protein [Bacteroidales bacterium]